MDKPRIILLFLAIFPAIFLCWPAHTGATGTPAETIISNVATLNYSIDGEPPAITLSSPDGDHAHAGMPTTFKVASRLNVVVAAVGSAAVNVTSGQSGAIATFGVTNTGNATEDLALSVANIEGGELYGRTDNFNAADCHAFTETNGESGYQPGLDTGSFIDELAPDTSRTIYVVCAIPPQGVGDEAIIGLRANIHAGGGHGVLGGIVTQAARPGDSAGTDDAPNDGSHSARHAYAILPGLTPDKQQ